MPRKGPAPKRPIVVDPVYGSPVVTQLVNRVLLDGKKSTAERIVYGALEGVRSKTDQDPVSVLSAPWTTSVLPLRFAPVVSVVLPTRFRLRFAPAAPPPWLCAGWLTTPASVVKTP